MLPSADLNGVLTYWPKSQNGQERTFMLVFHCAPRSSRIGVCLCENE